MANTLSFIVTARDESQAVLEATVDGLLATSAGYSREIIIVDDGSLIPISVERPDVAIVRNSEPCGVSRSRRSGASFATGDVLTFVDAHMSFAPDWLDRMLAHVDCGSLLCAAWWDWELTKPVCWGADFVWCGSRDYKTGLTPGFSFRHRTRYPGGGAVEVPMAMGACYTMLHEEYEKIGGFSPFFRIWGKSEQDISARAWIFGRGVKCVTGARAGHLTRSTFPYSVTWDDIEFNQLVTVRTVFERHAASLIEQMLQPLPLKVQQWADELDCAAWRRVIRFRRQISDEEFFRRFIPNGPGALMGRDAVASA